MGDSARGGGSGELLVDNWFITTRRWKEHVRSEGEKESQTCTGLPQDIHSMLALCNRGKVYSTAEFPERIVNKMLS